MGEWPMGELSEAIKAARNRATRHDAVGLENALESLVRCAESIRPGGTKGLVSEAMHKLQEETCDAVRQIGDLLSSKGGVTPSRELSSAGRLEALAALDTAFFSLVYALRSSGKEEAPSIIDHFAEASPGLLGKEGKLAWREFKRRHMTKGYLNRLKRRWKGDSLPNECAFALPCFPPPRLRAHFVESGIVPHRLLALHAARFRECLLYLWQLAEQEGKNWQSPTNQRRRRQKNTKINLEGQHDQLCPGRLTACWWQALRRWPCHIFAYAVPNGEALSELIGISPVVDFGAGTGYWVQLLRERGAEAVALDSHPPSSVKNEYHGRAGQFCDVATGDASLLASRKERTLLICYPPAEGSMAVEAVRGFAGEFVAHVGEFAGDTGTKELENELLRSGRWLAHKRIDLPNWPNTAYSLVIFRRASSGGRGGVADSQSLVKENARAAGFTCAGCGKVGHSQLRRCKWCRTWAFCSEECFNWCKAEHWAEHASRFIFLEGSFSDSAQSRQLW